MAACNKSVSGDKWRGTILCHVLRISQHGESTGPYVDACNKSVSGDKWRGTVLCQLLRISQHGESTGPYVERRSERIQHATHSGTTTFWSPTCGLCTLPYGCASIWYRPSYRASSALHQDPRGELTCIFSHSFNIMFLKLSLGHINLYPSARLLFCTVCMAFAKCALSGI